jgi:16S rRNA (adenine1518-N6/adenine1519-N6)-dimethyltransferase
MKKSSKTTPAAKTQLRRSGLKARKRLGQNFLTDETVVHSIIDAARLSPEDTVIEVGPGLGILTEELAKYAGSIIAVELDDNLAKRLKKKMSDRNNVIIVNADILKTDPAVLPVNKGYKVVANIPYYITSPILQHFITASIHPSLMVVMVQKEVGETITAGLGKLSVLAISLQIYTRPEMVIKVPAASFYPVPKVDSMVVKFTFLPEPLVNVDSVSNFLDFVKTGFTSPRKLLPNSLAQGLGIKPAEAGAMLQKAGIALTKRAEALTIAEWETLYKTVRQGE